MLPLNYSNYKYRKYHQVLINNYRLGQIIQQDQKKSFDFLCFTNLEARGVTFNEYEAFRRILSRKLLRLLRFSLRSKPTVMITAKPREMRMGKGKGPASHLAIAAQVGRWFVRTAWCHRQRTVHIFGSLRTALKKSGQHFYL